MKNVKHKIYKKDNSVQRQDSSIKIYPDPGAAPKNLYYIYMVTELDGITDVVIKIQRQKSSTQFYNLENQITEISNTIKIQILT